MRGLKLTLVVAIILTACRGRATGVYNVSEIQKLRLKVAQQNAVIAHIALNEAQQNFNVQYAALQQAANEVEKENKWPSNLLFDADKLTFSEAVKPGVPTPEQTPTKGPTKIPARQ